MMPVMPDIKSKNSISTIYQREQALFSEMKRYHDAKRRAVRRRAQRMALKRIARRISGGLRRLPLHSAWAKRNKTRLPP